MFVFLLMDKLVLEKHTQCKVQKMMEFFIYPLVIFLNKIIKN